MAYEPDDEERFRPPLLDAADRSLAGTVHGRFDRSSLVLWVSEEVSTHLDSQHGTLPEFAVERGEVPLLQGFSVQLHEIIHYWQTIGSTAGIIHSLGMATATYATLSELQAAAHLAKPLLKTISSDARADDPAYRTATCWTDIEHGLAMLDDPARAVRALQRNPERFVSIGHCLLTLCANTLGTLGGAFDPGFEGLVDPAPWSDVYEYYSRKGSIGFESDGFIDIPLGLRELFEGQARVSEVQFRNFTQRALTWKEVEQAGWLRSDYGKAFNSSSSGPDSTPLRRREALTSTCSSFSARLRSIRVSGAQKLYMQTPASFWIFIQGFASSACVKRSAKIAG